MFEARLVQGALLKKVRPAGRAAGGCRRLPAAVQRSCSGYRGLMLFSACVRVACALLIAPRLLVCGPPPPPPAAARPAALRPLPPLSLQLLEATKELITEANIEVSNTGISLQAMDSSHVSLVSLQLRSDGFEHFRCDRTFSMGACLAVGSW